MINKSPTIQTAYVAFSQIGFVANAGNSFPQTWTVGVNTAGWTTNPTTQNATTPLLVVPAGWIFTAVPVIQWNAGAPALTTTTVTGQVRDVVSGASGLSLFATLTNAFMAASNRLPIAGDSVSFNRTGTGANMSQLFYRVTNGDANAITVDVYLYVRAFKIT